MVYPELKTPRSAHPGPHGNKLLPSTVSDDDDDDDDDDDENSGGHGGNNDE